MSTLNNINGPVTPVNRKTISKVSLHLGECFKGELINLEGEEALILLPEGYKLRARIVGNLKEAYLSKFLFQLEDFKDGRVFLKIVHNEGEHEFKGTVKNDILKHGITSEDNDVALLLLRHNIPLTKSNLTFAKSILFLWGEGVKGEEYIDKFLDKYINLKSDSFGPLREEEVRIKLKEAFKEIARLTEEDLIIFLENDIALSKENITAYKKLVSSSRMLFDAFKALEDKTGLALINKDIIPKDIDGSFKISHEDGPQEGITPSSQIDGRETSSGKEMREPLSEMGKKSYSNYFPEEESVEINTKTYNNKVDNNDKNNIEKPYVERKIGEESSVHVEVHDKIDTSISGENERKALPEAIALMKSFKEEALEEITFKVKKLKVMVEKILEEVNKGNLSEALERELGVWSKDFKLVNNLSKEYYYFDMPLTIFKKEFPLKLIIKDDREGGKTLDSKDIKLVVSVAAPSLGTVDAYLEVRDKNLKVNITAPEKAIELFESNKDKLLSSLKTLGYNTCIEVTAKGEDSDASPLINFFKKDSTVLVDVLV